jgi:hypothetical protein
MGEPEGTEGPIPDFIVIGAQKGGTHWIRANLAAHPDVFMPGEELHFFTRPDWIAAQGLDGYRARFSGWRGEPVVGEATPGYLVWRHDPKAMASAMRDLVPDARLIAILREPVDRALSALVHLRRIGTLGGEDDDLAGAVRRRLPPQEDPLGIVSGGWYASMLRPYVGAFGDQLLVVLHDDLVADPAAVYDRLLLHIGLDPGHRPPELDRVRFSFEAERFGVRPPTAEERAEVFGHFAAEVDELEQLLGRDLAAWRPGARLLAGSPVSRSTPADPEPSSADGPILPTTARLLDLGSGAGASLVAAERRLGMRGLGIELQAHKVADARARGLSVVQGDILELDPDDYPQVEYVCLDNVLEHLPDLDAIRHALGLAVRIASRQVLVRHPSFEDVDYLAGLGLRLYWTDWEDHTAPARLHELIEIAGSLGVYDIRVTPLTRVWSSTSPSVLPLGAPPNQHRADPAVPSVYREADHGPKPVIEFDRPVYSMFEIVLSAPGVVTTSSDGIGGDLPGHAPRDWPRVLGRARGQEPKVVQRANGTTVVVEAGMVRQVASPLVARALVHRFGLADVEPGELRTLLPGPPVVQLKTPGESAFVVVGGRRITTPGLGTMLHTEDAWYATLDQDPPLDLLRAAEELRAERRRRQ